MNEIAQALKFQHMDSNLGHLDRESDILTAMLLCPHLKVKGEAEGPL